MDYFAIMRKINGVLLFFILIILSIEFVHVSSVDFSSFPTDRVISRQDPPVAELRQPISDPVSVMDIEARAIPGLTYPVLTQTVQTNFTCASLKGQGWYADIETGCQQYHRCSSPSRWDTYICPPQTLFSQDTLVCDFWYNVKCENAVALYEYANSRLDKVGLDLHGDATWRPATTLFPPTVAPRFRPKEVTQVAMHRAPASPPAIVTQQRLPPATTITSTTASNGPRTTTTTTTTTTHPTTPEIPTEKPVVEQDQQFVFPASSVGVLTASNITRIIISENSTAKNASDTKFIVIQIPSSISSINGSNASISVTSFVQHALTPEEVVKKQKEAVPGVSYPIYTSPIQTDFSCQGLPWSARYEEVTMGCQQYYFCDDTGKATAYICPIGFIFNRLTTNCAPWYNSVCMGFVIVNGSAQSGAQEVKVWRPLPVTPNLENVQMIENGTILETTTRPAVRRDPPRRLPVTTTTEIPAIVEEETTPPTTASSSTGKSEVVIAWIPLKSIFVGEMQNVSLPPSAAASSVTSTILQSAASTAVPLSVTSVAKEEETPTTAPLVVVSTSLPPVVVSEPAMSTTPTINTATSPTKPRRKVTWWVPPVLAVTTHAKQRLTIATTSASSITIPLTTAASTTTSTIATTVSSSTTTPTPESTITSEATVTATEATTAAAQVVVVSNGNVSSSLSSITVGNGTAMVSFSSTATGTGLKVGGGVSSSGNFSTSFVANSVATTSQPPIIPLRNLGAMRGGVVSPEDIVTFEQLGLMSMETTTGTSMPVFIPNATETTTISAVQIIGIPSRVIIMSDSNDEIQPSTATPTIPGPASIMSTIQTQETTETANLPTESIRSSTSVPESTKNLVTAERIAPSTTATLGKKPKVTWWVPPGFVTKAHHTTITPSAAPTLVSTAASTPEVSLAQKAAMVTEPTVTQPTVVTESVETTTATQVVLVLQSQSTAAIAPETTTTSSTSMTGVAVVGSELVQAVTQPVETTTLLPAVTTVSPVVTTVNITNLTGLVGTQPRQQQPLVGFAQPVENGTATNTSTSLVSLGILPAGTVSLGGLEQLYGSTIAVTQATSQPVSQATFSITSQPQTQATSPSTSQPQISAIETTTAQSASQVTSSTTVQPQISVIGATGIVSTDANVTVLPLYVHQGEALIGFGGSQQQGSTLTVTETTAQSASQSTSSTTVQPQTSVIEATGVMSIYSNANGTVLPPYAHKSESLIGFGDTSGKVNQSLLQSTFLSNVSAAAQNSFSINQPILTDFAGGASVSSGALLSANMVATQPTTLPPDVVTRKYLVHRLLVRIGPFAKTNSTTALKPESTTPGREVSTAASAQRQFRMLRKFNDVLDE